MDLKLDGKRALVTGSTAGIGHAIATRLAEEGAEVIISGRSQQRVDDAVAAIAPKARGKKPWGIVADLGTAAGARKLIDEASEVNILINNAGTFTPRTLEELTDEDWLTTLEVNLLSGARLSQHHLPKMLARNEGRIVFISSESALQIPTEMIHYGVSKTAQSALARGLAELTKGTAVTVNSILVGPTRSEGVERFIGELAGQQGLSEADVEKQFFTLARPTSLIQRFMSTEEIADVVAFVASPLASAINGTAMRAEGGLLKGTFLGEREGDERLPPRLRPALRVAATVMSLVEKNEAACSYMFTGQHAPVREGRKEG